MGLDNIRIYVIIVGKQVYEDLEMQQYAIADLPRKFYRKKRWSQD